VKLYLTISTFIGIFLEGIYLTLNPFANFSFDLKPGIIIVLFNLFILLLIRKIWLTWWKFLIIGYLLISSYLLMPGYESLYIKQLVQIIALIVYFYNLIRFVGSEYIFDIFVKSSYFYSIFALFYLGAELWFGLPYFQFIPEVVRGIANGGLHGLMSEQSVYSIMMIPSFYASLTQRHKFKLRIPIVIGISIIISGSAMGFIGIFLSGLLFFNIPKKMVQISFLSAVFIVIGLLIVPKQYDPLSIYKDQTVYYCYDYCSPTLSESTHHPYIHFGLANPTKPDEWKNTEVEESTEWNKFYYDRIVLSYKALITETLPDVHVNSVSAYTLMSNFFVMKQVIKNNPFVGGGLGSHPLNYDKYIEDIQGAKQWLRANVYLGRLDANSLGIRILSELGFIGFALIVFFFFQTFRGINENNLRVVYSIYIYLFLVLIRSGTYGSLDLFLFIFILYFITRKKNRN
jgi:hypothetical protein